MMTTAHFKADEMKVGKGEAKEQRVCVCVCVGGFRLTFASRCRDVIHSAAVRENISLYSHHLPKLLPEHS